MKVIRAIMEIGDVIWALVLSGYALWIMFHGQVIEGLALGTLVRVFADMKSREVNT